MRRRHTNGRVTDRPAACFRASASSEAPPARRRRASARVTLVLIGAASLHGCGDPQPQMVQRDLYENRGKCVQDWGDEKKCDLITEGTSRGYWYGPGYSVGHAPTAAGPQGTAAESDPAKLVPRGKNALGAHRVARSGFGSSARAYSSGS